MSTDTAVLARTVKALKTALHYARPLNDDGPDVHEQHAELETAREALRQAEARLETSPQSDVTDATVEAFRAGRRAHTFDDCDEEGLWPDGDCCIRAGMAAAHLGVTR